MSSWDPDLPEIVQFDEVADVRAFLVRLSPFGLCVFCFFFSWMCVGTYRRRGAAFSYICLNLADVVLM